MISALRNYINCEYVSSFLKAKFSKAKLSYNKNTDISLLKLSVSYVNHLWWLDGNISNLYLYSTTYINYIYMVFNKNPHPHYNI